MRFLFVADGTLDSRVRVANETLALVRLGHDVHVLAFDGTTTKGSYGWEGVHVTEVRLPKWSHRARALAAELPIYSLLVARHIRRAIRELEPDVLHVYNVFVWRGVRRALSSGRPPAVVLDIAENTPEIMQEYEYVQRRPGSILIDPKRWAKMLRNAISEASHVAVVTEEARRDYAGQYGLDEDKAIVVPNLVWPEMIGDQGREALAQRFADAFVVFYFGDTSHRRGTSFLLDCMPAVVEAIPEAQLVVVGRNTRADPDLQAQAAASPVQSHIHLEGFRPLDQLGAYLAVASVGTSPLIRNRHHDTTYANKLFQYMHGGVPLLVSDCPSQASLVERTGTGLVHRALDSQDFVDRLRELHGNEQGRRSMGEAGREFSRTEFVWTKCMAAYVERIQAPGTVPSTATP